MTIVHIGSLPLQVPESGSVNFINEIVQQMRSLILHLVGRCLEESRQTAVDRILGRNRYVGRRRAKRKESGVY